MNMALSLQSNLIQGQHCQTLNTADLSLTLLPQLAGRMVALSLKNIPNVFYPDRKFMKKKVFIDSRFDLAEDSREELLQWGGYHLEIFQMTEKNEELSDNERVKDPFFQLLNYGIYEAKIIQNGFVLISPIHPKVPLQLVKKIRLINPNQINFEIQISNHSNKTHRVGLREIKKITSNIYTIFPTALQNIQREFQKSTNRISENKTKEYLQKYSLNLGDTWASLFHRPEYSYEITLANFLKNRMFTVHPIALSKSAMTWECIYPFQISSLSVTNRGKERYIKIQKNLGSFTLEGNQSVSISYDWKFSVLKKIHKNGKSSRLARLIQPQIFFGKR